MLQDSPSGSQNRCGLKELERIRSRQSPRGCPNHRPEPLRDFRPFDQFSHHPGSRGRHHQGGSVARTFPYWLATLLPASQVRPVEPSFFTPSAPLWGEPFPTALEFGDALSASRRWPECLDGWWSRCRCLFAQPWHAGWGSLLLPASNAEQS